MNALIGYTGFVGGYLASQGGYDALYRSTNIQDISGRTFKRIVCAGAPGLKWKANQDPAGDRESIATLMRALETVTVRQFVLISTVDTLPSPARGDETEAHAYDQASFYGKHRREFELFCQERFDATILRLPGLFGPGLRKNIIFDLIHDNEIGKIHPNGRFQFYDIRWLPSDIERAVKNRIPLVHLATPPLTAAEIAQIGGKSLPGKPSPSPADYDFKSVHFQKWDGNDGYLYDRDTVTSALDRFFSEELSKRAEPTR